MNMARPIKAGLDYFPLDCQLDDKFELIEAEYGLTGFGVVVKLFQKIYGQNGYYIEWTSEVALLFAKRIGLGGSVVSEIVEASIRRGIFDRQLFERYSILTSSGIQKRYLEAVSRRKSCEIKKEYLLVKCTQNKINVDNNRINVDNNSENDSNNTQSKVKESRVKESRVKESKREKTLTPEDKQKLYQKYGSELTEEYIKRTTQYHCCDYETIEKWIEEDKEKKQNNQKKNRFNDFPQRQYTQEEMIKLERILLDKK